MLLQNKQNRTMDRYTGFNTLPSLAELGFKKSSMIFFYFILVYIQNLRQELRPTNETTTQTNPQDPDSDKENRKSKKTKDHHTKVSFATDVYSRPPHIPSCSSDTEIGDSISFHCHFVEQMVKLRKTTTRYLVSSR